MGLVQHWPMLHPDSPPSKRYIRPIRRRCQRMIKGNMVWYVDTAAKCNHEGEADAVVDLGRAGKAGIGFTGERETSDSICIYKKGNNDIDVEADVHSSYNIKG